MANRLAPYFGPTVRPVDKEYEAFLRSQEGYRGHPTAPGARDTYGPLVHGRQDVLDGQPGIPRLIPTEYSQGYGAPGPTPSGPVQPNVDYLGSDEDNL